jgi:hypothetical protein
MKFFIYPVESFVEITGKEWSITPMTDFFNKSKPVMDNAFHVIGDYDSIPTINSWLECDFLIVPLLIRHTHRFVDQLELQQVIKEILPYYEKNKGKHIFFIGSDTDVEINFLVSESIVFSFSVKKSSNMFCMAYQPIVSPPETVTPIDLALYDYSFMGYACNDIRKKMVKRMTCTEMKFVIINIRFWLERYFERDTSSLESYYSGLMNMSKFILCPQGFGVSSIRLFEAMSFGRIPIVISDEAKLPLEDEIDYNFLIRIEEDNIESIEKRIKDYKQEYNLSEMSVKARSVWEDWFAPKKIGKFLIKTLNKIC